MQKIVLKYGLIAGAILSAMMLATLPFMDRIGFDRGALIGYTTMVVAFLMIFFGVRTYREEAAGGQLTFGQAFGVGVLITVVATVCYVATWEFIYYRIVPDFGEKMTAHTLEKARLSGATAAELATQAAEMARFTESYKNPLVNIAFTFLEPLPVGLLMSLFAAWVHRTRKQQAD